MRPGDNVCLMLGNSPDYLYAWLGLARVRLDPTDGLPIVDDALVQIQRDLFALGAILYELVRYWVQVALIEPLL